MKRSQISFEFVILFAVALFIFMMFISLLPSWLEKTRLIENQATNLGKEVKQRLIIASLSESDYESTVIIPNSINYVDISVTIIGGDNLLLIAENETGRLLAKSYLPTIDSVTGSGNTITIKKTGGQLSVEQSPTIYT
jgi:hypothetical protein